MDTPQWQSTALAKRLIQELSQIRQHLVSLQEQVSAIRNASEAANEQANLPHEPQQEPPPIKLTAELQVPESVQRQQRTQNNYQNWIQAAMALGTWAAFLGAAYYAGITRSTLDEIRKQTPSIQQAASAAQQSANTAGQAVKNSISSFRLDQRAWMTVNFPLGQPKSTNPLGLANSDFMLLNIGRTQAMKVHAVVTVGIFNKGTKRLSFDGKGGMLIEIGSASPQIPYHYGVPITRLLPNGKTGGVTWNEVPMMSESAYVFGYATVKYEDIFGETHVIQYCQFLEGTFTMPSPSAMPDLEEQCVQYNRAYDE